MHMGMHINIMHMYTHTHIHITHMYTHTHIHITHMYTHTHTHIHITHMYTHTHTNMLDSWFSNGTVISERTFGLGFNWLSLVTKQDF